MLTIIAQPTLLSQVLIGESLLTVGVLECCVSELLRDIWTGSEERPLKEGCRLPSAVVLVVELTELAGLEEVDSCWLFFLLLLLASLLLSPTSLSTVVC